MRGMVFALLVAAGSAAHASGPYVTDDAAITPAGERQVETWLAFSGRGSFHAIVPAFTPRALPFLEMSVALDTGRLDGARETGITLQGKALLTPEAETPGRIAFAVAGGARFADRDGDTEAFVIGMATLAASPSTLLHGNLGWSRFVTARDDGLTWAFRLEQALAPDRLSLHAELFGSGLDRPGAQLGLRPTLASGAIDFELVVGRNLFGERATWGLIGAAFRF
ncbi:MAG: hypothetical protein SNJ79_08215 [Sphingomonadaceae bacterium]